MRCLSYLRRAPNTMLSVVPRTYKDGSLALECLDSSSGERIAVATVNLPDHPMPAGAVAIKSYSENEGMEETLVEGGIIEAAPFQRVFGLEPDYVFDILS